MFDLRKYDEYIHFVLGTITIFIMILFYVAMDNYPDSYDFFDNFLSDLGRSQTESMIANPFSSVLFTFLMIAGGLMLSLFFIVSLTPMKELKIKDDKYSKYLKLGALAGIISGPSMGFIGVFRLDLDPFLHYVFGFGFFILAGAAILIYSLFFLTHDQHKLKENVLISILLIVSALIISIFLIITYNKTDLFGFNTRTIGTTIIILIMILLSVNGFLLFISNPPFKIFPKLFSSNKFSKYVDFSSVISSIYILILEFVLLSFIFLNLTIEPVYEVVFVWSIFFWILVTNMRIILLGLRT